VNPIPQQSEAKPDLARTLRESCVRFTEAADESFFFRRLYLLLAALFGKIENIFLLWRAGNLPPLPVRTPRQTGNTLTAFRPTRSRQKTARRRANMRAISVLSATRPIRGSHTQASRAIPEHEARRPKRKTLVRRIDRYPKTQRRRAKTILDPHQKFALILLRFNN
jgi:hypothetical protein